MKIHEAWLKCQISDGMFPGEYAVVSKTRDDRPFSFFASEGLINQAKNLVKIEVLREKSDSYIVYLPTDPLENISRTIQVPKDQVKELALR